MPAQYLAGLVAILALFSLLSHLYRVQVFYGVFRYIPMPLYSAICFLLFSLSVLGITAHGGLMSLFTTRYSGSLFARWLMPAVVLFPATFGWLRLYGHWTGIFSVEFGVAILVLSIILFIVCLLTYTAYLLNIRDHEKEKAALALQKSEDETRYQALLLQHISDAIISTDNDFRIVSWNKTAEAMYGWSAAEVQGKQAGEVLRPVYEKMSREDILAAFFKFGYWKGEILHHRKDGSQLAVLVSSTAISKDGVNAGNVLVIRDITERRRAEKNFRDLLDAAPDATVIVDSQGILCMVNRQVEDLFGYNREELLGQPVDILMPLAVRNIHQQHLHGFTVNPSVRPMGAGRELQACRKDGSRFPVEISLSPLQTEAGLLISASVRDITERLQTELRLKRFNEALEQEVEARTQLIWESEKKYRILFNDNPLPMWVTENRQMQVIDVNEAALRHYGYSREEFLALTATALRPPEEQQKFVEWIKEHQAQDLENIGVWKHIKKDGTVIEMEIFYHAILYEGRPCRLILANDVTQRKAAEDQILAANKQLRSLTVYLERVREKERIRMAREVHDELGQQLTGLKMDIAWLSKKVLHQDTQVQNKFATALALTDETVKTVRRIATELRPAVLDDLGLIAAIEWYSTEFKKRYGMAVSLCLPETELPLDKEMATGLFRVFQETLTNIARHAGASHVKIALLFSTTEIALSVTDDGRGFEVTKALSGKSLGLLGLRERVAAMNGQCTIDSTPGRGTLVNIRIPF